MRPILAATLAIVLASTTPALSALPGPVGDEFQAGDRILRQGDLECGDAEGNLYRLRESTDDLSDPSRQIFVEKETTYYGAYRWVELDAGPALRSIQCTAAGTLLVILEPRHDEEHQRLLTYDPDGLEIGDFLVESDYWVGTSYGIHDTAGIYQTYWKYDGQLDHFHGRWLGYDGTPRGPDVELDEPYDVSNYTRQVLVRSNGEVLVAWFAYRPTEDRERDVIRVQLVDMAGSPLGARWELNQFDGDTLWFNLDAEEEKDGLFVVYWYSEEQGGRIGRYFSVDPDVFRPQTVTTTTLPPSTLWPGFRPGKKIGEEPFEYRVTHGSDLVTDGQGTWLASWWKPVADDPENPWEDQVRVIAKSTDLGRHWDENIVDGYWGSAPALSATGTAMLAKVDEHSVELLVSRDAGGTWNEEHEIALGGPRYPMSTRSTRAAVATDGSGNWGVAWSYVDENEDTWEDDDRVAHVLVAFSHDDGATWDDPVQIWSDWNESYVDVRLATNRHGRWVVATQTERAIRVARLTPTEFSWTETVLYLDSESSSWWDPMWSESLSLAHLDGDRWLMVFASRRYQPETWGADGDVFAIRSVDGGLTWNEPAPVNAFANVDGATDTEPSLAHHPGGNTMVVWRSHDSLGKRYGTDADILGAVSKTNGRTWSWPASVNPDAETDSSLDRTPKLAVGNGGEWLAIWTSERFRSWFQNFELFVAAGSFHPGDSNLDAAEQCDDGNTTSGDGCDADGTFTSCGNGIVTTGEACDDGNEATDDDCAECQLARCGDGFRHPPAEECDTGATTDDGVCLPSCKIATCGDGHLRFDEVCDDGNTIATDDCTNDCRPPVCGDAKVWAGHEECDDGDDWNEDDCLEGCKRATCGDGFVWDRHEICEPGIPGSPHRCGGNCRWLELCDANGKAIDEFTAGDALDILRTAVGITGSCNSAPRCDLDGGGSVTAIDAQMALRMAVGILEGICASVQDIRFRVGASALIGSLQISLDFDSDLGTFRPATGVRDLVCRNPFSRAIFAAGEGQPGQAILGVISLQGFTGNDLSIDCKFYRTGDKPVAPRDFFLWVDATDTWGEPLDPAPVVTILTP